MNKNKIHHLAVKVPTQYLPTGSPRPSVICRPIVGNMVMLSLRASMLERWCLPDGSFLIEMMKCVLSILPRPADALSEAPILRRKCDLPIFFPHIQTFSVTTAKMFEPQQPAHDLEFHSLLAGPFVSRVITTRLLGCKERLHKALRFLICLCLVDLGGSRE